ncbi:MAG: T9SS type A sorting domain-containing protein, partial [Candidatus Stygibacter frigidus]|nr:T9SS type A sorting domain-containing protein [Candidatus Stygibacter frigidus]
PEEGIFTWDIYVETMLDEGTFPDCDYIHVEVRSQLPGESWLGWTSISNPLYDPDGDNYVFTGAIDTWTLFTDGWGVEYKDITMLAGRNVQFRFGMHSNITDEVVPGGLRIDNFQVMQEIYMGPAPENLMAETTDDDQVVLSWDPIIEGGGEGWLQWDNGTNDNAIGYIEGGDIYAAVCFDQDDMMAYIGGDITQVEIYISDAPSASTLYVWTGSYGGTEIYNQTFTAPADAWITIDLDTPVTIEGGTKYWIGYSATHIAGEHPCGVDAGPAVIGKGEWVASSPGGWTALGLEGNWNIHTYVDGGRVMTNTAPTLSRNVTGYNVWYSDVSGENYVNIATVDPSDTPSYLHETPEVGAWNYYVVTALYDDEDGALSNEAAAYIMSDNTLEMIYDDGTAEEGFNVGIAQSMAVKFDPSYANGSCVLTHIRLFVETFNTGQLVMRIYDDSGAGGMPGSAYLAQFMVSPDNLTTGWNTIAIPEANLENVTFDSGSYYVSIFEMANISAIGKDTDSVEGQSYKTVGNIWEAVTDGNLMIRSYLYYAGGISGTIGDVDSNGEIEAYDASIVLQYTVGMPTPVDPFPENLADVDGNGSVEAYDAALILQYVVGIIDEFPANTRINDIPSTKLDYYFDGEELVITATGELYSASLEFPFKLEAEKLQINDQFISAVWGDKVAIASAYPVSGEILRIPVENLEGQRIFTSANSVRGDLMITEPVIASGIRSVYPNPFNPETTIGYNMGSEGTVKIDIYNCKGQKVETLLDARQDAGDHAVVWSAAKRASGIYFVRVNINGQTEQRKVLLIK